MGLFQTTTVQFAAKMFTARRKIVKPLGGEPDEFEQQVAQALFDLEMSSSDLKADLREVHITSAKEFDIGNNKKAIVIFVPVPLLKTVQSIQTKLVRELEKKFNGKHVIFLAQRRILRKPVRGAQRKNKQMRPVSRTLTAVHAAVLADLVSPTALVDQRLRVKTDGSKVLRIHLDHKDKNNLEYKLESFSAVYKQITGKDTQFDFARPE